MVSVRAAIERDAAAISYVHVQSWRTTYTGIVPEAYLNGLDEAERACSWREWLTCDIPIFVADSDGEIVGFASGAALLEPLQVYDAELFAICLLVHFQRRGIGTALLKAVARSLDAKGFKSMAVWVLESNSSSRFYEKSGALRLSSKKIEIGGAILPIIAYGWANLTTIDSLPELPFNRNH